MNKDIIDARKIITDKLLSKNWYVFDAETDECEYEFINKIYKINKKSNSDRKIIMSIKDNEVIHVVLLKKTPKFKAFISDQKYAIDCIAMKYDKNFNSLFYVPNVTDNEPFEEHVDALTNTLIDTLFG